MKIAALILGIFGGLIAAGLGIKWISDAHDMQGQIASLKAAGVNLAELDALIRAGYLLVVASQLAPQPA